VYPVFAEYRADSVGRVTPLHFFWGSMDLAVTRFSGRPCDPPPGADLLLRTSYDAEQISAGWWPGNDDFPAPAFYAYSYPKAEGIEAVTLAPPAAAWDVTLGEHILRYDDIREEAAPAESARAFLDSFFRHAAQACAWDAAVLGER
jgi:hypothetical protein